MKVAALAGIFLCLGLVGGWTANSWTKSERPSLDQETAQAATLPAKPGSTAWLIEQLQKDINEGFEKRSQELKGKEDVIVSNPLPTRPATNGCIGYRETRFKLGDYKNYEVIADCTILHKGTWYPMLMPDIMDK